MSGTLIVAEHLRGELRELTRELVTAAQQLGGPVTVAVIAPDPTAFDGSFQGVHEIVNVPLGQEEFENDVYPAALEALIADRDPHAVLLGFTVNSMGYGPAVAAKLALGFASDVHGLALDDAARIATRSFYGGKVDAELEFPADRPVLLLVRPTAFAPAADGGNASATELAVELPSARARHLELVEAAR